MSDNEYSPGDTVLCKVGFSKIVGSNANQFECTHHFDVICSCDRGYLVFVPATVNLTNAFCLTAKDCRDFDIPYKFMGGNAHFINRDHVVSVVNRMTGLACSMCKEYYEHAEINRLDKDGKGILVCWSCRNYRHYKSHI